jgi:rubrerythrin
MNEQTLKNMQDAFAGESQAHMKYMVFADRAEREGFPNIARLFRAASYSEQIHATNHLRAMGVGKTLENLTGALAGETYEIVSMYPAFIQAAQDEAEKRAQGSMEDAMAAEKVHADLYERAKVSATSSSDMDLPTVYVCAVCGYTMEGEAPDKCPICNAPNSKFQVF